MARVKNGIMGGFSGKAGPVVGYNIRDEWFMRGAPKLRTHWTDNELLNQAKFGLITNYLDPLKALIKVGFKNYYTKTGGYRAALSYTKKVAFITNKNGFYIDSELFRISGGPLLMAKDPAVTIKSLNVLKFTWDASNLDYNNQADQIMVLIYDPVLLQAQVTIYNGAFRKDGVYELPFQLRFEGREVDIHIGFVAADRQSQSNSQYLGSIKLPKLTAVEAEKLIRAGKKTKKLSKLDLQFIARHV
ncbi:DUF6266 family protein [Pedobacter metabolipauper]|uniref:Uncharacterized protein n=1 Tax=Pedobacter metabolipauper TaxID=425513 RepID=A0A4R6SSB3_9SPHI|nr:DUF6266 family protein [Pedobacter metabolipauper]TDQ07461.1 hypothetical protein ATK78_3587 [Pedobacter metabolipauper]